MSTANLINAALQAHHGAAQASLVRKLRSVEQAEDAMQEASVKALQKWPEHGLPDNATAWLVTTGFNSYLDQYRKDRKTNRLANPHEIQSAKCDGYGAVDGSSLATEAVLDDDVLRLIFMCCHPSIAVENQLAITLKLLMGFALPEIARALLIPKKTLEQRITRTKRKIDKAGISFDLPDSRHLGVRLPAVQQVLYLIFNEGYYSNHGDQLVTDELCRQAIVMTRSLCRGFPLPENIGLLALMLFQDARAPARVDANDQLITLDKQDRHLWKRSQIKEADVLLQKALRTGKLETYQLQAAIAGLHSLAESAQATDWNEIVALYQRLLRYQPSPVVELNYSVALMMAGKIVAAKTILDQLANPLEQYSPYYAAVAKLQQLQNNPHAAGIALTKAAQISGSEQERGHYQLQRQIIEQG